MVETKSGSEQPVAESGIGKTDAKKKVEEDKKEPMIAATQVSATQN